MLMQEDGQAGVVERRGAQGYVGKGCEGGAERYGANQMRAAVLSGMSGGAWEAGPRSATELKEAGTFYDRAAALCVASAQKAKFAGSARWCRYEAEAM
eukprot:scaffold3959_cov50-Phaeocystis_antarctica.AAC.2